LRPSAPAPASSSQHYPSLRVSAQAPASSAYSFSIHSSVPPRRLHSFPTRRSSDLSARGAPRSPSPARRRTRYRGIPMGCRRYSRSEEHTSELQSLAYLVCRLLLEKKKRDTQSGGAVVIAADALGVRVTE